MKPIMAFWVRFHREDSGQGLIEYVLFLALIALAAVTAMQTLASDVNNAFSKVASMLNADV